MKADPKYTYGQRKGGAPQQAHLLGVYNRIKGLFHDDLAGICLAVFIRDAIGVHSM